MRLTNEVCLLAFIFIERLIVNILEIIDLEIRRCANFDIQLAADGLLSNYDSIQILGRYQVILLIFKRI